MTNDVQEQYEAYPYPARDPADEAKRLIAGSPSHPAEIDHYLFAGKRDWTKPFRVLVAGGGTGDSLIMLGTLLEKAGVPTEIIYLDLSKSARKIAEARAAARKLNSITFVTGDLRDAGKHGSFDYIDCCGVLHHLPTPQEGFDALAAALRPDGGIGAMVYAPYGRTGVYPLQEAFGTLFKADSPQEKLALARNVMTQLPKSQWFTQNKFVGDHETGDAGFYDLLLHSQDTPFTVKEVHNACDKAGLQIISFIEPILYDPAQYLPATPDITERLSALDDIAKAHLAEQLSGAIKTHVFYACKKGRGGTQADPADMSLHPRLYGISPRQLAREIATKGVLTATFNGVAHKTSFAKSAAPLAVLIDGRPLKDIAAAAKLDPLVFNQAWQSLHRGLTGLNALRYSTHAPWASS
jgi:SAM-dependent methyltransferase